MSFRPRGDGFRPRFCGPPDGFMRGRGPSRGYGGPRFMSGRGGPSPGPRGPPPGRGGPNPRFQSRGPSRGGPFHPSRRPQGSTEAVNVPTKAEDQKPPVKETKTEAVKEEVGQDVIALTAKNETPKERITLDEYNCDLHFEIEKDGLVGSTLHKDGFEYIWGGGRATHGIKAGRVCFEVEILEELPVNMPSSEKTPHVLRVGWSVDNTSFQLGEDDLSYGYGGTAKSSLKGKFTDYGKRYQQGDIIGCFADLDSTPRAIFFTLNGDYLGIAFKIGSELDGKALFPHINGKNTKFAVNFGEQWPRYPLTSGFTMIDASPTENLVKGLKSPSKADAEIIMMVGLPAAGKTFWAEDYAKKNPDKRYYILGTNNIIDKMKVMGLTRKRNYHGRWDELIKQATTCLNVWFKIAERRVRNYILDQTNVYFTARRRKMRSFLGYKRIAAVVINEARVLQERTSKREREEGKMVPESAVMEMKANFSVPEKGESFEEVLFIEEKLPRAKELVDQFNREGKEFKQSGKGATQDRGPPAAKVQKTENSFRQGNQQPFQGGGFRPRAPPDIPSRGGHNMGGSPRFSARSAQPDIRQPTPHETRPTHYQDRNLPGGGNKDFAPRGDAWKDSYDNGMDNTRQRGDGYNRFGSSAPQGPVKTEPPYGQRSSHFEQDYMQARPNRQPVKQEPYDDSYNDYTEYKPENTRSQWGPPLQGNEGGSWSGQEPYVKSEDRSYRSQGQSGYEGQGSWSGQQDGRSNQAQQGYGSSQGYSRDQRYPSYNDQGRQQSGAGYGQDSKTTSSYESTSYGQEGYGGRPQQQINKYEGGQQSNYYGQSVKQEPITWDYQDRQGQPGQGTSYNSYQQSSNVYGQQGTVNNQSSNQKPSYDQKPFSSNSSGYYGQNTNYSQAPPLGGYSTGQASNAPTTQRQTLQNPPVNYWQYGSQPPPPPPAQPTQATQAPTQAQPHGNYPPPASVYNQPPPPSQAYGGYGYGQ